MGIAAWAPGRPRACEQDTGGGWAWHEGVGVDRDDWVGGGWMGVRSECLCGGGVSVQCVCVCVCV